MINYKRLIILPLLLALVLFASCSSKHEEAPGKFTEKYYNELIKGNYEGFVDGMYSTGHVGDSYRKEKIVLMKHFMKEQEAKSQGIKAVSVADDSVFSDGKHADVFLNLTYGNGQIESVLVPMVKEGNDWKMN